MKLIQHGWKCGIVGHRQRVNSARKFHGSEIGIKGPQRSSAQIVRVGTFNRSRLVVSNVRIAAEQHQSSSGIINRHGQVSAGDSVCIIKVNYDRHMGACRADACNLLNVCIIHFKLEEIDIVIR